MDLGRAPHEYNEPAADAAATHRQRRRRRGHRPEPPLGSRQYICWVTEPEDPLQLKFVVHGRYTWAVAVAGSPAAKRSGIVNVTGDLTIVTP